MEGIGKRDGMKKLRAPFPFFGGKSLIAREVWSRLGDVANYVEPFAGSLAVLMARPHALGTETVNDRDGMISNFWRAVAADAAGVARYADWPVNENDLHARHMWLVERKDSLQAALEGDPEYYDVKIAGWWCWGICCWIGGGFCSGRGPWKIVDGLLVRREDAGRGVRRQLPHLGNAGQGVTRKRLQLSGLCSPAKGAANKEGDSLREWMEALSERLRRVRVCCGDWSRVMGPAVTFGHGLTGIFLDPPYGGGAGRDNEIYRVESKTVAQDVMEWGIANGGNALLRIAICGYEGEREMPGDWEWLAWKSRGGYGSRSQGRGRENSKRERIWFSPGCVKAKRERELTLWSEIAPDLE